MSPLEAALVVAALVLPFYLFATWQIARLVDPRHLRRHGVVIRREEVLQAKSRIIGYYAGREIYASVTFMGMEYRFEGVVAGSYRGSVSERELFLEPGLLYVTD